MQIKVTIELFGELARYREPGPEKIELSVEKGTTIAELACQLGIEEGDFIISSLNGNYVPRIYHLADGDSLILFPPMAGG